MASRSQEYAMRNACVDTITVANAYHAALDRRAPLDAWLRQRRQQIAAQREGKRRFHDDALLLVHAGLALKAQEEGAVPSAQQLAALRFVKESYDLVGDGDNVLPILSLAKRRERSARFLSVATKQEVAKEVELDEARKQRTPAQLAVALREQVEDTSEVLLTVEEQITLADDMQQMCDLPRTQSAEAEAEAEAEGEAQGEGEAETEGQIEGGTDGEAELEPGDRARRPRTASLQVTHSRPEPKAKKGRGRR